jgi:hypothetical protein
MSIERPCTPRDVRCGKGYGEVYLLTAFHSCCVLRPAP